MSRGKLAEPEIKFGPTPEAITAAYAAARNAIGTQEVVAEEVGVSETTLGKYETKPGRWMNAIRYFRFLYERTGEKERHGLAAILGVAQPELDPQVALLAERIQQAKQYSDWSQRLWQIENALGLHGAPGTGSRGDEPAAEPAPPKRPRRRPRRAAEGGAS